MANVVPDEDFDRLVETCENAPPASDRLKALCAGITDQSRWAEVWASEAQTKYPRILSTLAATPSTS